MPYLKSVEEFQNNRAKNNQTNRDKKSWIYNNVYNTSRWQKLRKSFLCENPICEECKKKGIITPATHVHHIYEISNGKDDEQMKEIAFNWHNLMSLCDKCHKEKHEKKIDYFLFD